MTICKLARYLLMVLAVCGGSGATSATAPAAPTYTVTDIGYLGAFGSIGGGIAAINGSGTVAVHTKARNPYGTESFLYMNGARVDIPGDTYATRILSLTDINHALVFSYTPCRYCLEALNPAFHIFRDGRLNTLNVPDFTPQAMNDAGQIAGAIPADEGRRVLALYSDGKVTPLGGMLEGVTAVAMNRRGQIAGNAWTRNAASVNRAFLYSDGKLIDLGTYSDEYLSSQASGMNESGQVVGLLHPRDSTRPVQSFLYADGKMTLLGSFSATAITNRGAIAGHSDGRGLIYCDGKIIYLDDLPGIKASGWKILAYGVRMNDNGRIAVAGETADQKLHALLLTPLGR